MTLNFNKCKFSFVSLILLFLLISSCRTQKNYISNNFNKGKENINNNYSQIQNNAFTFNYLIANYEAEYTQNETTTSFSGQLRMRYDSIIWLSVNTFLGIEVSRIVITKDSIKIIDRLHSNYLFKDVSYLQKTIHPALDFFMIQSLLTDNDLKSYDTSCFSIEESNQDLIFSCVERKKKNKELEISINNTIKFDKKLQKITQNTLSSSAQKIIVSYKNFVHVGTKIFPSVVDINIITSEKKNLFLTFKSIKHNIITTFPFKLPARYEPSK